MIITTGLGTHKFLASFFCEKQLYDHSGTNGSRWSIKESLKRTRHEHLSVRSAARASNTADHAEKC
jgi:hypothetical protein